MEFIRTIRQKQQTARQDNLLKEAEEIITLADFDSTLYIAYNGVPLIEIGEDWLPKQIVEKLSTIRNNYINAKNASHSRSVAVL